MALACHDQPNHAPGHPLFLPGVLLPQPCHVPTISNAHVCERRHNRNFRVCDTCVAHTSQMLLLAAPVGAPAPANLLRLSNGHGNPQPGVSPPELPPGAPAGPPFVAEWRTANEAATGHLDPNRPDPPFDGFLTRCCTHCEKLIQSEINYRAPLPIIPFPTPPPPLLWEHYPRVSCTCRNKLGLLVPPRDRLCKPHRQQVWDDLLDTKEHNDRWLSKIQWDASAQKLVPATTRTIRRRIRNRYYRACRVSPCTFRCPTSES